MLAMTTQPLWADDAPVKVSAPQAARKSKTYTFTARPGVYEEGAIKAASLTNSRLIGQLVALR